MTDLTQTFSAHVDPTFPGDVIDPIFPGDGSVIEPAKPAPGIAAKQGWGFQSGPGI